LFFSLLAAGTSIASASDNQHGCHHAHKGNAPKGHGRFEPVAFETYSDSVEICGGITITPGNVFELKTRDTVLRNGSTLSEYRGRTTNDITDVEGRKIDELDTSGPFSYLMAADQQSGILTVNGPALIYPFSEQEQAVFDADGLSRAFFFRSGTMVAKVNADFDITEFIKVPRYVSVCDLLRKASRA
jgi:hypothetical protein